jgi:hypothetical protein
MNEGKHILVFSDSKEVEEIAKQKGTKFVYSKATDFQEMKPQRQRNVRVALRNKYFGFRNPELVSAEYVCIQNCKFEAVVRGLDIWPHDFACWIDAGLRHNAQRNLETTWDPTDSRIRVALYNPLGRTETFILETPGSSIMGGAWGGATDTLQWLFTHATNLQNKLLSQGKCANDQQILTLLVQTFPQKFCCFPLFTRGPLPWFGTGKWHRILDILSSKPQKYEVENWKPFFSLLFACIAILLILFHEHVLL